MKCKECIYVDKCDDCGKNLYKDCGCYCHKARPGEAFTTNGCVHCIDRNIGTNEL